MLPDCVAFLLVQFLHMLFGPVPCSCVFLWGDGCVDRSERFGLQLTPLSRGNVDHAYNGFIEVLQVTAAECAAKQV